MICLPTLILGVVLAATFFAHLFKGNGYNAMLTFFFALVVVIIVHYACIRSGDMAGWIAFAAIIGFLILAQLARNGVFDKNKLPTVPECPKPIQPCPGPDPCPPTPGCPPIEPCDEPC
jgi:uncharacterized membrane protein YjjP (DUF1212 family)